jgi:hypothetical protein
MAGACGEETRSGLLARITLGASVVCVFCDQWELAELPSYPVEPVEFLDGLRQAASQLTRSH